MNLVLYRPVDYWVLDLGCSDCSPKQQRRIGSKLRKTIWHTNEQLQRSCHNASSFRSTATDVHNTLSMPKAVLVVSPLKFKPTQEQAHLSQYWIPVSLKSVQTYFGGPKYRVPSVANSGEKVVHCVSDASWQSKYVALAFFNCVCSARGNLQLCPLWRGNIAAKSYLWREKTI